MAQQQPPVVAAKPVTPSTSSTRAMQLKVGDRPVTVHGSLTDGHSGLTPLPLALTVLLAVVVGLCLAIVLLRLHLKRREETAAREPSQLAEPPLLAPGDYVLPETPLRCLPPT